MISVNGASFGRFGGWRRRYPGGSECRSIFLTVARAMPNRLAASRWLRPSTWQASRTRRYRSTVYILPPSISKKIEGYRWQSFTPPAAGKSRRFRGLICHRRSHSSFVVEMPNDPTRPTSGLQHGTLDPGHNFVGIDARVSGEAECPLVRRHRLPPCLPISVHAAMRPVGCTHYRRPPCTSPLRRSARCFRTG